VARAVAILTFAHEEKQQRDEGDAAKAEQRPADHLCSGTA
jgi:hypothetical protein